MRLKWFVHGARISSQMRCRENKKGTANKKKSAAFYSANYPCAMYYEYYVELQTISKIGFQNPGEGPY